ncbi:hypothetical protein JNB71_03410 [Rhizobium herbae]|uniref:Head decoration protein n=1 Tax=Rhizobium herbae TaxID=508661 RepID=A0ABS7H5K5_9HYPH|nr:hypothetical protein [Rhizobium herbae]MBW9062359.1 hypothetical protein [Rhizobium herbae]
MATEIVPTANTAANSADLVVEASIRHRALLASDNTTGAFDAWDGDAVGAVPDAAAYDMVLSIDPLTVPAGAAKVRLGVAFASSAFTAEDLEIASCPSPLHHFNYDGRVTLSQ